MREIKILRKLTQMDTNIFVTKIYDIIVPDNAILDETNIVHHPDLMMVRNENQQPERITFKNPDDEDAKLKYDIVKIGAQVN